MQTTIVAFNFLVPTFKNYFCSTMYLKCYCLTYYQYFLINKMLGFVFISFIHLVCIQHLQYISVWTVNFKSSAAIRYETNG